MRKFLLLFFVLAGIITAQAQTNVQIGSGTTTATYFPHYYLYDFSYSQTVYTAAELTAGGAPAPGFINKIKYKPTSTVNQLLSKDWEIYLVNTSKQGFSGATDYVSMTSAQKVFDGAVNSNYTANTWMEVTLQTPFMWDGTSNVLVTVVEKTPGWTAGTPNWAGYAATASSGSRGIYFYMDGTPINAQTPTATYSGASSTIAQIIFEMTPATACSGTPVAGTISLPSGSIVCTGGSLPLNHTGSTSATGLSYQLVYSNASTGPWTAVGSSSSTKFSSVTPAASGYYRVVVACGTNADTTNAVNISVAGNLAANTYTVGGTGANFATLTDAINAAKCGVAGRVTFKLTPGTYTEQITIPEINGLNASTRLTIDGNGATLKFKGTSALTYTLGLNGADYITVKNLTIEGTNPDTGRVVHLWNDANNNIFDSVTIKASLTATSSQSVGFCVNGSISSATTGGLGSNNKLLNSKVIGGYYGVNFYGAATTGIQTGNEVVNTMVQDFYYYGIYFYYNTNPIAKKNIIERPTRSVVSAFYGLYLSTGCINGLVEGNKLRNSFGNAPNSTDAAYAIYVSSTSAAVGTENKVYNNAIYNMNGNGTDGGLYFSGGTHIKAYHNTVVFDKANATTTGATYGIYSSGTTNVDFKNNMISITKGGTGTKYSIYFSSSTAGTRTSNYNVLHMGSTAGTGNNVGYNGTARKTLSDWQTATSQDANSLSDDPMIINYTPTSSSVDNKGTPITDITTDIDGNVRSTSTPDMGALEFTITNCSGAPTVGTISIDSSVCPGKPLSLKSTGSTIGDGITYEWEYTQTGTSAWTAVPGATTPNFTLTSGITEEMDFRLKVSCNYSGQSSYSAVKTVHLNAPLNCYCIPYSGSSASSDVIAKFELDTLVNVTNGVHVNGYSDFTSKVVGLHQGMPYTAKVTGYIGSGIHGVAIWIDYNNDGNFDVSERLGYASNIQPSTVAPISFTVDPASTLGHHRMRVMYQYNKAGDVLDPCVGVLNGETEDYTVDIKAAPSCAPPTNVSHTNVLANSFDVTFDAPVVGATVHYELYYNITGVAPTNTTTPTISNITASPYTVTGTQANTKYYVWMRTFCGGTSFSDWSIKDSVLTECSFATLPIVEGFEGRNTLGACWKEQLVTGNNPFKVGNTSTASATSPNPAAFSGDHRLLFNSYSNSGTQTRLVSPIINGNALSTGLDVTFYWYFSNLGSATSYLTEGVQLQYSFDGVTWVDEGSLIRRYGPTTGWSKQTVSFPAAAGQPVVYVGFLFTSNAGYACFMDSIRMYPTPTCYPPTGLSYTNATQTSINVNWMAPTMGSPVSFDIYYNTTGVAPTASTTPSKTNVVASPDQLTGLTANTKYYVWMRSFCGGTDYSEWTMKDSFRTTCAAVDVPYVQDFETAVVPGMPDCTSAENVGAGNPWITASNPGSGFTTKVLRYSYHSTQPADAWFYTQGINLTAGTSYRLKFDYGTNSTTYTEKLKVSYGTSADHLSMTNDIIDLSSIQGNTKRDTTIDFVASTTGVHYLGFNVYSPINQNALFVDNIKVTVTPTCDVPTGIVVGPVTESTADVSWTAPTVGTPVSYDIYYNTTGVAPTTSTTPSKTNVVASPYQLTALTANTKYYIWMRTFCGGTDYSAWTVKDSFRTTCSAATIPFTEGFEGSTEVPNCWSQQLVNGNNPFKFGNSTNAAGTTVNPDAYAGNHRLYFNSYSNSGTKTRLVSPPINLTGVNTGIDVSFYWYFSTNGGATSYLTEGVQVQYSLDGVNWTDEGSLVRRYDAVAGWRKQTATIAGAVGQPVVYVGFLFTSNAGYPSYMDSIHIYASPTCLPPTNIMATASTNTADIQWTPPMVGTPISYDVYYSKSSTPPTASTNPQQTNVSATNAMLTGLDVATAYYVWVRTFCGGTDRSEWSSALKFNTACDVLNTPWSEGFENAPGNGDGVLPFCWSKENIAGSTTGFGVSNTSDAYRGPRTGAYALYTRYSSTHWIYTPGFNLSQDSIYEFSFYMMNKYGTAGFTMDVAYGTDTAAAAMTNSLLAGYAANNTAYTKFSYVIQPTATGVYYFGIKSTSPNTTPWYLNFDDFSLITTGSVPVTISSFKAENAGSVNNILWTTATEQNNAGFEVERSADGNKFEKMAFVASKAEGGNSASTLHYSLTDNKPFVLGTYYRLKQLDKDGKSTYSNVVFVKSGSPVRMEIVNLYPNPAKERITLLMTAPTTNKVQVVVSDLSGRVVMSENRSIEAGENKIMLNVNNLPSGTYMLKAVCADGCESAVKKFVKE